MKKKIYLLLIISLYLGFPSRFSSVASDNLSFEDVKDEIDSSLKIMPPRMPALFYQKYRDKIEEARLSLDLDTLEGINGFISLCRANHVYLMKSHEEESDFDFFESEIHFKDYLKENLTTNELFKGVWFIYYLEGAKFYFDQQFWSESENLFIKAARFSPTSLNSVRLTLQSVFIKICKDAYKEIQGLIDNNTRIPIFRPDHHLIPKKFTVLYTNFRKLFFPKQYDSIDITILAHAFFGAGEYENSNQYLLKLLKFSPQILNHHDNILKPTHDNIKVQIAKNKMLLKEFEEAKKCYLQCNCKEFNAGHYKDLSLLYALEKNWSQSFYYFKQIFDKFSPDQRIISLDETNVMPLAVMLMKQSKKNFNQYGKYFIDYLKQIYPHLKENLESLKSDFILKQEIKVKNVILEAIAFKRFETLKEQYNLFLQEHLSLWNHCSALSSEDRIVILDSMDDLVTLIKDNYHHLKALEAEKAYVENMTKITNLSLLLTDNFRDFSNQVKEKKQKIFRIQRQIHKALSTNIDDEASTYSGISNLKSQFLSEQTSVKEKAKEKEDLSKGTQQKLPEQRKQLKNEDEKNNYPQNSERGMLRFFKNDVTKRLWDTQEVNHYPQKALEMLSALNAAQDMIHLRSLLTPGTILKILKGDRQGQLSLRINDQYRLCFNWITGEGAFDIEIVDYHR